MRRLHGHRGLGVHGLSAHDVAYLLCQPAGWQRLGALMRSYHRAFGASTNRYLDGGRVPPSGKRTMRTGVLARVAQPSDSKPTRKQRRSSSMVPIKDANIRRLLLEYLIAMIEEGDLQALLDEGIEPHCSTPCATAACATCCASPKCPWISG